MIYHILRGAFYKDLSDLRHIHCLFKEHHKQSSLPYIILLVSNIKNVWYDCWGLGVINIYWFLISTHI